MLPHAPGVQVQTIPEDAINDESEDEDKIDKDDRLPQSDKDKRIVPDNEFSDSEDEGEGGRRDNRSYKGQRKRPRLDKTNDNSNKNDGDNIKDEKDTKSKFVKNHVYALIVYLLVLVFQWKQLRARRTSLLMTQRRSCWQRDKHSLSLIGFSFVLVINFNNTI